MLDPREDLSVNGRVLCTERTDPGWAPLFPTASGLVVERGSALSHSAVVAREFGIPTVVGVPDVTRILTDGELVRVDGAAGEVQRINAPIREA
jgi:pyruvate,water dikinase